MALLRVVNVTFYTSDDDKRAESHIDMKLVDSHRQTVAIASGSYGRFNDGTTNGPFGLRVLGQIEKHRLLPGGAFILSWTPWHNTDQWHLAGLCVDLVFDDSTHLFISHADFKLTSAIHELRFAVS